MRSVFAELLRLLPSGFRERFGAEMLGQIESEHERAQARGLPSSALFVARTTVDLLKTALVQRLDPTFVSTSPRGGTTSTLEDVRIDVAHALRGLKRAPGFTVMTV